MNILVILNNLDIGGAQNYTISLMNEFIALGHKVELRILSNILFLEHRLDKQINVKVWKREKKLDFNVLLKVRNELKQNQYDAVIVSYILYQKLATLFLKNKPITIYPIHFTIQKSKKAILFNHIIFRCKWKNEIFLTSIDNQTKYLTKTYHLKPGFFKQIYNGVDIDKFTLTPHNFNRDEFLLSKGINPQNKIILMVAGFREEKRHIDAIEAFKLIRKEMKNVSLVFVGDNRKKECGELIQYAEKKDAENIHFFTANFAGDVKYFYWSSDIFTLTSNKVETFPITVLEAMASGLPCVLTDVGGAEKIIHKAHNCFLVYPNNIKSISNGWSSCLQTFSKKNQHEIRNNISMNYSISSSAKQYLKIIRKNYDN